MNALPKGSAAAAELPRRRSRVLRLLSAAAATLALGCAAVPIGSGIARADAEPAPVSAFDADLMYRLLVAEIASRRGQLAVATESYLDAAAESDDPRLADRAARLALFARRWVDAERAARRWLELDGDSEEAHELLAQAQLRQGETEAAAQTFVALVGTAPPAATGGRGDGTGQEGSVGRTRAELLERISATLRTERPETVSAVVDALVEAYPEEPDAWLAVARYALERDLAPDALAAAERALALVPAHVEAELLRARALAADERVSEALAALEAALERAPDDARLRLGRAQLLVAEGRVERALDDLERLHESAADDAGTALTIALLALEADAPEPARRYLETVLASGEYLDEAHFYLARLDDRERRYAEAVAHYEAVQPGPFYGDARIRAAELHALEGDIETGRERLRELAAALSDPSLEPRLLIAESRLLQEAEEPAEAVAVLSEGLERFPDQPDLLYARALAADAAGDPSRLERDLERLIELEPDNAHALNALGYHFADTDQRLEEAAVLLEKANRLEPDDAAILDSLGWLRYRQGDLEAAVTLLREAHALYPDGEIAAHLGEVLWAQGEREKARAVWEAALAESPDHAVLRGTVDRFLGQR